MSTNPELKNRIIVLANGKPASILAEMDKEINVVQSTVDKMDVTVHDLEAMIRTVLVTIKGYRKQAEKMSNPLSILERKIHDIESKPGIQRYHQSIKQLDHDPPSSATARNELKNQIHSLKATYSQDLSALVSYTQQALVQRLNLIQYWKSMVILEIGLLDNFREALWKKIMSDANASGDAELIRFLNEQRNNLESQKIEDHAKLERSSLQVANVQTLKSTLRDQLNEVIHLENSIHERKEALRQLESVTEKLNQKKDEVPQSEQSSSPTLKEITSNEVVGTSDKKSPSILPSSPKKRMAYTDKQKKS